jgi:hypothetical protein
MKTQILLAVNAASGVHLRAEAIFCAFEATSLPFPAMVNA